MKSFAIMKNLGGSLLAVGATVSLAAVSAHAGLFYDSFGNTPSATPAGWTKGGADVAETVNASLAYSGGAVSISGGNVALELRGTAPGTEDDNNGAATQALASYSGTSVYVSFLVAWSAGTQNNGDLASFWLGGAFQPQAGVRINAAGDLVVRPSQTPGGGANTTDVVTQTTYFAVAKFEKTGGSTTWNKASMWVNPTTLTEPVTPSATETLANETGVGSLTTIGFRTFNLDEGDRILFDELRIGTSYDSVVPEPGEWASIAGLGLVGFACWRRRLTC